MFNDLLNETVLVRCPTGNFADGQAEYCECPARAFVFEYNERLLKEIGLVKDARFFVIAATPATVAAFTAMAAGTVIVFGGREYDVKTVRPVRGVDGQLECYSCAGV